jgi:hypothetical protein
MNGGEIDQAEFFDRLKASYLLAIGRFTQDLPGITNLPAKERIDALQKVHVEFAPKAIAFLSDLAHSTASVVRAATTQPSVKSQTLEKLKSEFLVEVYDNTIEELRTLAAQAATASAAASGATGACTSGNAERPFRSAFTVASATTTSLVDAFQSLSQPAPLVRRALDS